MTVCRDPGDDGATGGAPTAATGRPAALTVAATGAVVTPAGAVRGCAAVVGAGVVLTALLPLVDRLDAPGLLQSTLVALCLGGGPALVVAGALGALAQGVAALLARRRGPVRSGRASATPGTPSRAPRR